MAKRQFVQRFGSGARLALAAVCGLALMTVPVVAQFGGQFGGRGGGGGGGFFDLFGPGPRYAPREREQDFSKAPPPRKAREPAGDQRDGVRRLDGRLARLRP